jgi:hypothetical protein
MCGILDESGIPRDSQFPLLIRNWEIEISREFIWKRLGKLDESEWQPAFEWLYAFSKERLRPEMLPKTSIRWRGIVGLIGTANIEDLQTLLKGRRLVLENKSFISKVQGILISNWVRLRATIRLPKSF